MDFVPPVTPELEAGVVEKRVRCRVELSESNQIFGRVKYFAGAAEKEH
jgi:hypothetical protein